MAMAWLKDSDRRVILALIVLHGAQIAPSAGNTCIKAQRLAQRGRGAGGIARAMAGRTQIVPALGLTRMGARDPGKDFGGRSRLPVLQQRQAQISPGRRLIRCQFCSAAKARDCCNPVSE